jgi:serine/threonine-protein kinase
VIAAGQTIGNYRILNKIGTGGMGAVYLAEHPLIGKRVALKVIHRELAGNHDVVSRFMQEARAVNKIGSEHIVEIHDFGVTPEGDHFFIMEYLEGKTLASILARGGPMEMMRTLHVGAQIASALAAAHAAGIIHRDLKPDNIMLMARLGDQDFVKVLDFGLAKVFSAATAVKTAAGVLLGTPQYMSPEACESKGEVDHRTDIYALGVLLFQMLTGVLPFDGQSMGEVLVKQVTALPPAPRALNPAIPPSVEQILLRCLAKPVDARFATMMQLREALLDPEAYLRGSPPIAPARSVSRSDGAGDAKTLMVTAAHGPYGQAYQPYPAPGAPAASHPANAKTRYGGPGPLPLPAPPMSIHGASGAATMIGGYGDAAPRRATSGMPALAPPQEPKMNTMRIATPVGYSSRPPRKVWPVVLILAVVLGLGGGIFAVARYGRGAGSSAPGGGAASDVQPALGATGSGSSAPSGSAVTTGSAATSGSASGSAAAGAGGSAATTGSASGSGAASGSASVSAAGSGAGSANAGDAAGSAKAAGAGDAAGSARTDAKPGKTAHLSIDSAPQGATVIGPQGETLGRTPLELEWPVATQPVSFELRLAGYRKKERDITVTGNTALRVDLERLPARRPVSPTPGSAPPPATGGNGLMRPDD